MSVVGIRAAWTCARCGALAVTRQVTRAGSAPEPPAGWSILPDAAVVCGAHGGAMQNCIGRAA